MRIILYEQAHFATQARLEQFSGPLADAFASAHYDTEFGHPWLFVPVQSSADLRGILRLLDALPEWNRRLHA